MGDRVLGLTGLQEGCGEVDVGVGAIGAQVNGLAIMRDGFGWAFELMISHCDAVLGEGFVGVVKDGFFVSANSVFKASGSVKDDSASIKGAFVFWVEGEHFGVVFFGVLEVAQLHHGIGIHAVCAKVVGQSAQGFGAEGGDACMVACGNKVGGLPDIDAGDDFAEVLILNF